MNKKAIPFVIVAIVFVLFIIVVLVCAMLSTKKPASDNQTPAAIESSDVELPLETPAVQDLPNVNADELYGHGEDYLNQTILLHGTITYISDYGDLVGYYLYGSMGDGVVCWIDNGYVKVWSGDEVVIQGTVTNLAYPHVELTNCKFIEH